MVPGWLFNYHFIKRNYWDWTRTKLEMERYILQLRYSHIWYNSILKVFLSMWEPILRKLWCLVPNLEAWMPKLQCSDTATITFLSFVWMICKWKSVLRLSGVGHINRVCWHVCSLLHSNCACSYISSSTFHL